MSRRCVYIVLLAVYAVALSVITLRAQHPGTGASATWVPLTGIWHLLTESEGNTYLDVGSVVGNIVLFVPLGWLLPMVWPQLQSLRRVVVLVAACSIAIELAQFAVPGRTPTTDDVLLNTVGGLIGAIMFFAPLTVGLRYPPES